VKTFLIIEVRKSTKRRTKYKIFNSYILQVSVKIKMGLWNKKEELGRWRLSSRRKNGTGNV